MNEVRAQRMAEELTDRTVGGWRIERLLGAGKSAVVFAASQGTDTAALKVFDPEIVEEYGREVQLARIARECSLQGKTHPHLIKILGGGECDTTKYLFVAMELIDAPNLHSVAKVVPRDQIWKLIGQVAQAAKFLEDLALAHRDIKPQNIVVTRDWSATLLDLGVLRPFGDGSLTDENSRPFIGTLRYSSPEFLLRKEADPEGWAAVTFYQLGAVLHDLIMRRQLFDEFSEPYARLAKAVENERPLIEADDIPADLVLLARNCLVKNPSLRRQLVDWQDFQPPDKSTDNAASARDRIRKRAIAARDKLPAEATLTPEQLARDMERLLSDLVLKLDAIIRLECGGNPSFPRFEIQHIASSETQLHILVTFPESEIHSLNGRLCLLITAVLVELESSAFQLSCAAAVSHGPMLIGDFLREPVTLFNGVFAEPAIKARIDDLLCILIDQAQSVTREQFSSGPKWLNCSCNQ